jgi:hypothetical protein
MTGSTRQMKIRRTSIAARPDLLRRRTHKSSSPLIWQSAITRQKEFATSLDILRLSPTSNRLTPVHSRLAPLFCLVLLAATSVLASFAFACATLFAAFAVIAAAMLPLPAALLVVTVAWIVNEGIGFGALGYPHNVNTVLRGFVIGGAALIATTAAKLVMRALPRTGNLTAFGLAFVGAYAAYELVLFAATPVLGGSGAFTSAIIGRLGVLSLLWLIGLVAACGIFYLPAFLRRHQILS